MGKNYIESSLKRFLKRKVKITLGLVVTFLITGMVSFAGDKPVEEMNDFEKAEHYLSGLNSNENKLEKLMTGFQNVNNGQTDSAYRGIKLDSANNKIILEKFKKDTHEDIEISLKNENISNVTAQNIKTALENGAENINNIGENTLNNQTNDGILLNVIDNQGIAMTGNSINNGIISSQYGQRISGGNQATINNGIISYSNIGQYIHLDHAGSKIYNNGIIAYNPTKNEIGNAQSIQQNAGNSKIFNNGIIINGKQNIQSGTSNEIYNYGVIENGNQNIESTKDSKAYNYGIIYSNNANGQEIKNTVKESEIFNYGLIETAKEDKNDKFAQSVTEFGNSAYNYGIIRGKDNTALINIENDAKAYNDGIIINENGTGIYSNDISNKENVVNNGMLVIKGDSITDNFTNNGVVLNNSHDVIDTNGINKNVVVFTDKQEITNSTVGGTETGKTSGYIKNGSVTITENLTGKNLNTVVTDDFSGKAVFTYKNDENKDLNLINTTITGYFTNKGTLLDIQSGKTFTLAGDSRISAIKDKGVAGEDVTAVKLSNGAILNIVGNAEIIGNVVSDGEKTGIGITAANKGEEAKIESGREASTIIVSNADKSLTDNNIVSVKDNYTNVEFENVKADKLELHFEMTAKDKINKIVLKDNVIINGDIDGSGTVKYDGTSTDFAPENKIDLTVNNISNITGNITLGECDDIITVNNNGEYTKVIDGNLGTDTLNVNGNTKKAVSENIFDYKVNSIENINLNGDWRIGKNAEVTFKNNSGSSKAVNANSVNLNVSGKLTAEMNNNKGNGDFTTSLDKITSGNDMTVTAKGGIKYEMGENFAINSSSFTTNSKFTLGQYEVEKDETTKDIVKEDTKLSASGIFEISQNKDNSVTLRVKSADELGIGSYAPVYEAILAGVGSKQELTDKLNSIETSEGVANLVKGTTEAAKAYYTAGNVVTKNIVDTYLSSVTEFKDKADKGEWIAYGKYINSDTEFDGGSEVKGYDGDIKGTVGMIEYGMTDSTSYGAVFGKGDTKVDINDGGELSGNNYYGGLYFKHRTAEGIDVLGSFGIVKSDLDSKLKNSFEVPEIGTADALVDGTADSKAVSAVLKAKKDYYVAEGLKVQPVVGAALTLITQEEAENKKMGLTISQQDVDVYELITGVNVIKEFALESGKLEVGAGVEYSWANSNQDRDAKYMLNGRELTLEDSEIASSRGKAQFGAEYIHENGVGIDAKYEMMWSDSGDDSRITAGISYRF